MEKDNISRRQFLKTAGTTTLALGTVAALGCTPKKAAGKVGLTENDKASSPDLESGQMPQRTNPRLGDKISLLGFGCMRWPMVKHVVGKDQVDQDAVNQLVDFAMAHGVNYYDTSPAYLQGQSEKAAGIALSRYPREKYFIATKLSNFNAFTKEISMKMYHDSFEQLQTEYFDYYLLHGIGMGGYDAFKARYIDNGILEFLNNEKAAGRIRNLGFSFHGNQQAFDKFMAMHDSGEQKWDFVQIEMNYVDWTHADGVRNVNADYLYAELDKRGIPIVVMEPLLGGRLADVPENVATQLKEREPDKSLASWAFRFVGTYPRVLTILSGMSDMEALKDNLATFRHFQPLTDEELQFMETMATLMKEFPTVNCNDCKYCMPCPFGIDIPGIFKHYNQCVTDGTFVSSKEQKDYDKLRRRYLISYDRAIPTLRQASHCIGCGQCMPHCPQSIKIPEELHRIDRYVEKLKRGTLD